MGSTLERLRHEERGSAVVEFSLVSVLLTALVLGVLQLAFALHVRNTVLDAAAEGARYAALADRAPGDGVARTRELITAAIGSSYAVDVSARYTSIGGVPAVEVRVAAPLPLIGPIGIDDGVEVSGHAASEQRG
jgi:Flp pilus assembly pilin Flp